MEKKIREILERPFAAELIKQREQNGKKFDYVEIQAIEQRLNDALEQDGWEFQLDQFIQTQEEVIQYGRIGIPGRNGAMIWKADVGCQQIIYKKNAPHEPGNEVSLGNNMKMAASDCLKRCAKHLGVALDLYGEVEEDPLSAVVANIQKGEEQLSKKLNKSPGDIRQDYFGEHVDDLVARTPGELEEYLTHLRSLRDADKPKQGTEDKPKSPAGGTKDPKLKALQGKVKGEEDATMERWGMDRKGVRTQVKGSKSLNTGAIKELEIYSRQLAVFNEKKEQELLDAMGDDDAGSTSGSE